MLLNIKIGLTVLGVQLLYILTHLTYYSTKCTTELYGNTVKYYVTFKDGHGCVITKSFSTETWAWIFDNFNKLRPFNFLGISVFNMEAKELCLNEIIDGSPFIDRIIFLNITASVFLISMLIYFRPRYHLE